MKILHYFLGFPPYRSGGMTKFAFDLMKSQAKDNNVFALWPGTILKYKSNPRIIEGKKIEGIRSFELINPLPVSLDEGIVDFLSYTRNCDINIYISFLKRINVDVIHLHTLMGIHKEFIEAANYLGIRTVYTSHDYFGLCPKVTFFRNGKTCDDMQCTNCASCNQNALSLEKIKILQSPIYRMIKNCKFIKKLRKKHRDKFFKEQNVSDIIVSSQTKEEEYSKLRRYYIDIYEKISFIHFNSSVSEKVFKRFIMPKSSGVITITHNSIKDNTSRNHNSSEVLKIYYLSPTKSYKGWDVLKEACDKMEEKKINFKLHVFDKINNLSNYMIVHENGYKYDDLSDMMTDADVVVAPSICYETFGFTVLEAISYGVPVVVSENVGAKDIIGKSGIVSKVGNSIDLMNCILHASSILETTKVKEWNVFLDEIYNVYKS